MSKKTKRVAEKSVKRVTKKRRCSICRKPGHNARSH